ncbi:MAG: phosphoserine phosphatase SerB [Paramuribaculum sp.]|nr:phosphoserine phosphatase SerB [Paramuribaculum sp.]
MTELILINISGKDHSGVTAALTAILAKYNAEILDIGQSNIHHILSLGFLIKTDNTQSGDIMKEILFKSYDLNVNVGFQPVSIDSYDDWVGRQGRTRWIITVLGRKLDASHIAEVSRVVAEQKLNIDAIRRLTGRLPLDATEATDTSKQCVEFSVRGNPIDKSAMQDAFMRLAKKGEVDVSLQEDNMFRRCRRLICFDMDSTLIGTEVIDELAERAGVGDRVRAITERAMRGEIDFCESFRERCALLKGLDVSVMQDIAENLPITEGLDRLMTVLKRTGYKTAILSGGFTYFGNYLKRRFGFDYVYANELEIDDTGHLTGRSLGEVVDGKRKAELLKVMAQVEQVDIQQTVAVGDGANDLPMLSTAGLGIAFHAKPKVKAAADQNLSTIGLDGILYFLGFKDSLIQA